MSTINTALNKAISALEKFWKVILAAYAFAFLLVSLLFWLGIISSDPNISVSSLWRLSIGLRLIGIAASAIAVVIPAIFAILFMFYLAGGAVLNGEWEWFSDVEGVTVLGTIGAIASMIWALFTTDATPLSSVLMGLFYWPWILGFLYVGVRGVPLILSTGILHREAVREAAGEATYEKGVGFWVLVFSLSVGLIFLLFNVVIGGSNALPESVSMLLVPISYLGNIVGIYLDLRKTGLYDGTIMGLVFILLAIVPGIGYFVTLYYLMQRQLSSIRWSDGEGTETSL